jgi:flagellar biosynthesis/type III secretory pathway protein FliH
VYEYQAISILDYADRELEGSENPFALVVLAAKTALLAGRVPEEELLERKVAIGVALLRKGFSGRKVRAIFRFLENVVLFENREMNCNFMEKIQSKEKSNFMGIDEFDRLEGIEIGMEQGMEKGLEMGEQKGRQEAQQGFIENLLAATEFSDDKIALLTNVSVEVVEEVRRGMN